MLSEKTLIDEIKQVKKEIRKRIKSKEWAEVYRQSEVLCTLEFVRDWDED